MRESQRQTVRQKGAGLRERKKQIDQHRVERDRPTESEGGE